MYLTYLPVLKERGFLDTSLGCATKAVLPSLHVRLESPNALWRLPSILPESLEKSSLKDEACIPLFSVTQPKTGLVVYQGKESLVCSKDFSPKKVSRC